MKASVTAEGEQLLALVGRARERMHQDREDVLLLDEAAMQAITTTTIAM